MPVGYSAAAEKHAISLDRLRITAAPAIRDAAAQNAFRLHGGPRILLHANGRQIGVKVVVVRDGGEVAVYRIQDATGEAMSEAELGNSTVEVDVKRRCLYLSEFDCVVTMYRMDVRAGELLFMEAQRRGLHLIGQVHSAPQKSVIADWCMRWFLPVVLINAHRQREPRDAGSAAWKM